MFEIKTFNQIANEGLMNLEKEKYKINNSEQPDAILLRSQKLHDYVFPESVLCVARAGAGTNNIPVKACTEKGIVVFNTLGANANAVKELVIASLLLSVRPILEGHKWVQTLSGEHVEEQVEAQKSKFPGTELAGKKLGIIGLGSIGVMVANDADALGMEVIGYDPYVSVDAAWTISHRVKRTSDISDVFSTCDFISIHVPLMENTRHLVSDAMLDKMKATAKLFNFSRKEIVDTDAVLRALKEHRLAGYTTDFADEKLLGHDLVLVLPHLGASTEEAEFNCAKIATNTLKKFLEVGTIERSVNFPAVEMAFHSPYRLTIINRNVPNTLGQISSVIALSGINIDNMLNRGRDDFAYTLVDVASTDEGLLNQLADQLRENKDIKRVRVIKNQEVDY